MKTMGRALSSSSSCLDLAGTVQQIKDVKEVREVISPADLPVETQLHSPGVQTGHTGVALHVARRRCLDQARTRPGTVHGQARGRLSRHLLVVSLRRSAVLPAIRLERRKEGEAAGVRREAPRRLADQPGLHGAAPSRGKLATLDPALLVTPPKGLEVGYVPIVTHQESATVQPGAKSTEEKKK